MKTLSPAPLGGMSPTRFLREYWQKRPLLIRQAFAAPLTLPEPDQLFELAREEEVESRLVIRDEQDRWKMEHGPFKRVPGKRTKNWTLLVQGVNLYHPGADQLLREFSFLPYCRLDDVMVSYASDGGGVGAHVDSYDVFLLQTHGARRWKISAQQDLTLIADAPLKLLKNFKAEEEYVLEPGDMLYLPPHYAHEGTAIGECMTASIGFRAPAYQELGDAFLEYMADSIDLPGRYVDPGLKPTLHPGNIGSEMISEISAQLEKIRFTTEDMSLFIGEYLSSPKHNVVFNYPAETMTAFHFKKAIKKSGIKLNAKTQLIYYKKYIFINGESLQPSIAEMSLLRKFSDTRLLTDEDCALLTDDLFESLYLWFSDGWLQF